MENNNQNQGISKALLFVDIILVFLIISLVFVIYSDFHKPGKQRAQVLDTLVTSDAFDYLNLTAKSAYVFDLSQNKVIFKKNEFIQLPLASITKLMMALTASDLLPLDSHVTIRKEFLDEEGDSGLFVGETWKLQDLIDFSLVVSSNDGARSLSSVAGAFDLANHDYVLGRKNFVDKMNLKAKELGLLETYFINESGLDEGSISGGYSSVIDVTKLLQYILENRPRLIEATKYHTLTINSLEKSHIAKNTDDAIDQIPGLIASKTGYTDLAGGNLVVAFDASIGRPIIVVVLGSTEQGRFDDVSALVRASLEYVRN